MVIPAPAPAASSCRVLSPVQYHGGIRIYWFSLCELSYALQKWLARMVKAEIKLRITVRALSDRARHQPSEQRRASGTAGFRSYPRRAGRRGKLLCHRFPV